MFNVTLLTDRANSKFIKKKSANFRTITLDYDASDGMGPEGASEMWLFKHISWYTREFTKSKYDNDVIKQMKALDIDGAISFYLPAEIILVKRMGKPMLNFAQYLFDPLLVNSNRMVS